MAEQACEFFGSDGFRGIYDESEGQGKINPDNFARMAYAYVENLREEDQTGRPIVFVGGDTRTHGYLLRHAVGQGAAEAGAEVRHLGIAPTPVIAWLAQYYGVGAISVTASHNPDGDNGFKPFAIGGAKYSTDRLLDIEDRYRALGNRRVGEQAPDFLIHHSVALRKDYLQIMQRRLGGMGVLENKTLVLDCANGAALDMAPQLFEMLGARVVRVACKEQENDLINDGCGATHIDNLQAHVKRVADRVDRAGFLGGLAFDGDADRVLAVSPSGQVINGNHFMLGMAEGQKGIVGTLYTNTGLRNAVNGMGVEFHECGNGDSQVTERLNELTRLNGPGYSRGGEPSGHLIDTAHLPSGDGPFMGARQLARLVNAGAGLDDLYNSVELWPEEPFNVELPRGMDAVPVANSPAVQGLQDELLKRHAGGLRIVLRPSGTEPLIRIWAESPSAYVGKAAVRTLRQAVESELARAA